MAKGIFAHRSKKNEPSGDMDADLEIIRNFYTGVTAKFPHQFGEISFKRQEQN